MYHRVRINQLRFGLDLDDPGPETRRSLCQSSDKPADDHDGEPDDEAIGDCSAE